MRTELFRYTARTAEGEFVAGALMAETAAGVAIDLRRRALFVTSVSKAAAVRPQSLNFRRRRTLHGFFRSFAVLIRSGIPIRRALRIVIQHSRDRLFRETLKAVLADVEHGASLSVAMARRPVEFPALLTAMIGAGEAGGVLDDVLDHISSTLDREHEVHRRLQSALVYPAVVAASAGVLLTFLITRVVPMFASMFDRFGVALPAPTRILLRIGTVVAAPFTMLSLIAFSLAAVAAAIWIARTRPAVVDRVTFALPVIGEVLRLATRARIARMLGRLLLSGVGILRALEVLAPVSGSKPYVNAISQIGRALERGDSFEEAVRSSGIFDSLSVALIAVGEEAGRIDQTFLTIADYLDIELQAKVTTLSALVEPLLIGGLGLVVALIVFSIFLPLYALMGSIA